MKFRSFYTGGAQETGAGNYPLVASQANRLRGFNASVSTETAQEGTAALGGYVTVSAPAGGSRKIQHDASAEEVQDALEAVLQSTGVQVERFGPFPGGSVRWVAHGDLSAVQLSAAHLRGWGGARQPRSRAQQHRAARGRRGAVGRLGNDGPAPAQL